VEEGMVAMKKKKRGKGDAKERETGEDRRFRLIPCRK
jgi:hypothetical protein